MAHSNFQETSFQKLFRSILQRGDIPRHVALVLDGNRRYAREKNMKTIGGHRKGSDVFEQLIEWAMLCGVQEITAYVFSINNFSRTEEEVDGIMALLKEKLEYKLEHPETLEGKCYRFIGNRSLVPEDLKPAMSKITLATRNNSSIFINIAFAYTGRDEIVCGVNSILKGIRNNEVAPNWITESLFEESFHNCPVSSVDLFIRTGECRLSDFLTWETSEYAILCFRDEYWPTFSYWEFLITIFQYQASKFCISAQNVTNNNSFRTTTWKGNTQELSEFVRKKIENDIRILEVYAAKFEPGKKNRTSGV